MPIRSEEEEYEMAANRIVSEETARKIALPMQLRGKYVTLSKGGMGMVHRAANPQSPVYVLCAGMEEGVWYDTESIIDIPTSVIANPVMALSMAANARFLIVKDYEHVVADLQSQQQANQSGSGFS